MSTIRSIIKYPGSKRLMINTLFKHLPRAGEALCEPMVGSATVALNTDYKHYFLNDANADLIELYKLCVANPEVLIKEACKLFRPENNNELRFELLKAHYNQCEDIQERALLLFYLGRHGFNGLIRYSKRTGFNVPFGDGKPVYMPEKEIYTFADKLKHAHFFSMDFEDFIQHVTRLKHADKPNLYIDPPYLDNLEGKKSFVNYTAEGFDLKDHIRINNTLVIYRDEFERILVSNHKSHDLKQAYSGLQRTVMFRVPRTISSNIKTRKPVREVLMYY